MIDHYYVELPPHPRGYHLITSYIHKGIGYLPEKGLLTVFIQHTSAALMINENADPTVRSDFERIMNDIVPENLPYLEHTVEGPDDMPAHVKAAMMGSSVQIPFSNHSLLLGTWQGIYLCEFRNRASGRRLVVSIST